MTYGIGTVNKVWIKQLHARMFVRHAIPGVYSFRLRIAPVSVATHI